METPDDYEVLFTHGGGHGQFAALPLNLCHDQSIDGRDPETGNYTCFPELTEAEIDPLSKYAYLCPNETVNGIELHRLPKLPESRKHIPLVVDARSDFTTKLIDWHGAVMLFACASKKIGHPGLTMTVIRKDLLGKDKASPLCPGVFNYTTNSEAGNLWNTPATFNIEVVGYVMDWLQREGGVLENERRSIAKAQILTAQMVFMAALWTIKP